MAGQLSSKLIELDSARARFNDPRLTLIGRWLFPFLFRRGWVFLFLWRRSLMLRGLSLRFWRWCGLGFLPRWRRSGFVLRWRRLLRTRLRLDLLLTLRRRRLLTRRWCLLRARLWLDLLLALRRWSWGRLILRRRRLLRVRLRLNLLLARRRRLLRTSLRLNLLLARGRRCCRLISGRLVAIGLLLNWGRSWLRAGPTGGRLVAIRLNILLGPDLLTSTVRLLL